jgi:hypothetical protein
VIPELSIGGCQRRLAEAAETLRRLDAAPLLARTRTVAHHLANVFPELGIVSRADLARIDFGDGLHPIG